MGREFNESGRKGVSPGELPQGGAVSTSKELELPIKTKETGELRVSSGQTIEGSVVSEQSSWDTIPLSHKELSRYVHGAELAFGESANVTRTFQAALEKENPTVDSAGQIEPSESKDHASTVKEKRGQLDRRKEPMETVNVDEMTYGSTDFCYEAIVAMQVGKVQPIGYDKAVAAINRDRDRIRPSSNLWVLVEADMADRVQDLMAQFPDVVRQAMYQLEHARSLTPRPDGTTFTSDILKRVSEPNYKFNRERWRE